MLIIDIHYWDFKMQKHIKLSKILERIICDYFLIYKFKCVFWVLNETVL